MSKAITDNSGKISEYNGVPGDTRSYLMMFNMCAKFHQNPCINLGGVGGTNLCLRTDRLIPVYPL
jgi:hypothetical protein